MGATKFEKIHFSSVNLCISFFVRSSFWFPATGQGTVKRTLKRPSDLSSVITL